MNNYIIIRNMKEKNLEQVCEIENHTFSAPWSFLSYQQAISNRNNIFLVAEENGEILGYCGCLGVIGEGQITNVAVKKEYRGQNIGFQLMERLLKDGEKKGIQAFTLEVRVSNYNALKLYDRLGFSREGIRKNYYTAPREDAVIMWKHLNKVPL